MDSAFLEGSKGNFKLFQVFDSDLPNSTIGSAMPFSDTATSSSLASSGSVAGSAYKRESGLELGKSKLAEMIGLKSLVPITLNQFLLYNPYSRLAEQQLRSTV